MLRWKYIVVIFFASICLSACGSLGLDGVTNEYGDILMTSATHEITLGETERGELESTVEAHNYTFEGSAGQSVSIEVKGELVGIENADPRAQLFSPSNELLAESSDISVFDLNAIISHTLPEDGTYTVRVTMESMVGGYTITVTETE